MASSSPHGGSRTALAPGAGRSFYSCIISSGWPVWGRRFQIWLYLVGPPEDSLRLWLRHSLVPGWTHPCSGGGHRSHCPPLGRYLHGCVVVVLIVHLEWESSSLSNTCSFWAEPNIIYFYTNKTPRLGMEGPRTPHFWFMLSLEHEAPWLAYGFALAASTSVDSPRRPFRPLP